MCCAGWSVVADAVIAVVIVGHVGVVMVHVVWVRVRMRMWMRVRVRVRGVIMLKTACTAWLLSCNEAAATPADSGAAAVAAAVATSIAATAAAVGIVAMYAHVPIQVARL